MQFREMNYEELMNLDGGKGALNAIGDFFTGLADGFWDWFMAI